MDVCTLCHLVCFFASRGNFSEIVLEMNCSSLTNKGSSVKGHPKIKV